MNKLCLGLVSSVACLLILSAVLVVIISVMYSVSYSLSHLWKLPLALPMFAAGLWLLKKLDKDAEK